MPFAHAENGTIHWDERGSGSPLLLIMGHTYDSHMWYPVLDDLSQHHRLIWFDHRGTGKSPPSRPITIRGMVRDAAAVLDAAGVEDAHVYGVSMGGGVALEMGRTLPDRVRSLILGCTLAKTPDVPGVPAFLFPLLYLPSAWIMKALRKPSPNPYGSAAGAEAIARDELELSRNVCSGKAAVRQARAIARYTIDPDDVRAMDIPALVLHGTEDAAVAYEAGVKLAELLPNSELVTFDGAGHNYFVAYRQEANDATLQFLAEVDKLDDARVPG